MLRKLLQRMFARFTEIVLSLALVLASFLVILLLLSWRFPEGSSLAQLMTLRRSSRG